MLTKMTNIRLVFWLVFSYQLLQFSPSMGEADHLPWKNADRLIKAVCPTSSICELNDVDRKFRNACCEECTCQENSNESPQCFMSTSETETCMNPNTKHSKTFMGQAQKELIDAYLIITKSPAHGCVDADVPPCNADNILALAPVFSEETNNTYFNKECAACHGTTALVHWDSVMICEDFNKQSKLDFDQQLQTFLENPASSLCFIHFTQNNFTPAKKCTLHKNRELERLTISADDENRTKVELYGMSINDIADACMSDFYNPVFDTIEKKWFPNPFCYIHALKSEKEAMCYMTSTPGGNEYMALLNPKAMESLGAAKADLPKRREVCAQEMSEDENDQNNLCREVSCPLGHVFGKDSTCSFIGKRILFHGYSQISVRILIKREEEGIINGNKLTGIDIANLTDALKIPRDWGLIFVGHPTDNFGNERLEPDWLLVGFSLGAFENALYFMKNGINQSFQLNDGTKIKSYHQSIYLLSLNLIGMRPSDIKSKRDGVRCPMNPSDSRNTPSTPDDLLSVCWQMHIYKQVAMDSMVISKLYFCNLVQLMPNEFEIQANGSMLYNKVGKIYLYEKEFVVLENLDGDKVVKVCVEDSGLVSEPKVKYDGANSHGLRDILSAMSVTLVFGKLIAVIE